jgi:hypothetical protein
MIRLKLEFTISPFRGHHITLLPVWSKATSVGKKCIFGSLKLQTYRIRIQLTKISR